MRPAFLRNLRVSAYVRGCTSDLRGVLVGYRMQWSSENHQEPRKELQTDVAPQHNDDFRWNLDLNTERTGLQWGAQNKEGTAEN